jgi:hypothetical protein
MVRNLSNTELILKTIFGELTFSVTAKEGDLSNAKIVSSVLEPMIPDGMAVEESIAVLLRVKSSTEIENLKFMCTWNKPISKGGTCSGEGLDAWEWESDNHLILIGTEDEEWLSSRLGPKYISESPVIMGGNGFEIHIEEYPKEVELTLHYIVSSNSFPEKEECSCWFAVDVSHKRVLEACQ